jgi:hypothetical protein
MNKSLGDNLIASARKGELGNITEILNKDANLVNYTDGVFFSLQL